MFIESYLLVQFMHVIFIFELYHSYVYDLINIIYKYLVTKLKFKKYVLNLKNAYKTIITLFFKICIIIL